MRSEQSAEYGFSGLAPEVYEINVNISWANFTNHGPVRACTDGTIDAIRQRKADAVFSANMICYNSKNNVRRAVINILNVSVPRQ